MGNVNQKEATIGCNNDQRKSANFNNGDDVRLNISELKETKSLMSESHVTPDNFSNKLQLPKKTNLSDFFQTGLGISRTIFETKIYLKHASLTIYVFVLSK